MEHYNDKRIHARRPHLKAVYIERLFAAPENPGYASLMAHGLDISQSGIGLTTPQPLIPNEAVRLLFPMPDLTVNLPVAAGVVWSKPEGHKFRAGLRFLA
jgi:hypothetical protein